MANRVSITDLLQAAEWLQYYEPAPDEDGSPYARVASWLESEAVRRQEDAIVRNAARKHGKTTAQVRAALKRSRGFE